MEVLSAADLVPEAYAVSEDRDSYDDLHYDLYNLMAIDPHSLPAHDEDRELTLLETSSRAAQLLVKRIFLCPSEKSEAGPLAVLPEEVSVLPREKRVPEPKPETRWEKFAREKGILKRKKERMVWDETTQMFVPRFGYKSVKKGVEEQAIVEVKPGQDPFADPWEASAQEKKQRQKKIEKSQRQNLARASKRQKAPLVSRYEPSTVPGIPVELTGKRKRGKEGLRNALQLVQHSTASMGQFDERREGEPARKIRGKKRSFRDNIVSAEDEKVSLQYPEMKRLRHEQRVMKAQLRIVSDKAEKKARGVTNSLAPYEGWIYL